MVRRDAGVPAFRDGQRCHRRGLLTRPYESAYGYRSGRGRPILSFDAELPTLQVIGRKGEAVVNAAERFAEGLDWRSLVDEELQLLDEEDPEPIRVQCGGTTVTPEPAALFDDLEAHQARYLQQITIGLRTYFDNTVENRITIPEHKVWFPEDASDDEVLDRFSIIFVDLSEPDRGVSVIFEALDWYFDEHGCDLCIRDGELVPFRI